MNQYKGRISFIAIDGPNGAGKSTLIELLKNELQHSMQTVVFTKEPTNSELGQFMSKNTGNSTIIGIPLFTYGKT